MRLFYKHLLRTVRGKVIQPLVLIFTIALSAAMFIFALTMNGMIKDELTLTRIAGNGRADIVISLSGTSHSRFMFASDVEGTLDEPCDAIGCFELPAFYGEDGKTVFCVATELDSVSDFFDFEFEEILPISPTTVGESVFISRSFADENGLAMGDTLRLDIGKTGKTYVVRGITNNRIMASYDVMMDISGVVRVFAASSPLVSALGDSFRPSSKIYVDVLDNGGIADAAEALRNSESFSDKDISLTVDFFSSDINLKATNAPMSIAMLLVALLSASVIFTCFYILSLQRSEENEVFLAAGARPRMIYLSQYAEVLVYWLVGGLLGALLSVPLNLLFTEYSGYEYATPKNSSWIFATALVSLLLVAFATVTVFILSRRLGRDGAKRKNASHVLLALPIAYAIFYISVLVVRHGVNIILYSIATALMILSVYVISPYLMRALSARVGASLDKRLFAGGGRSVAFRYAIKNIFSVRILHNTARLVAVTVVVVVSVISVMQCYAKNVDAIYGMLTDDLLVINASDRCYGKLSDCEGVESVNRIYLSNERYSNGIRCFVVSADSTEAFSSDMDIDIIPEGEGALIPYAHAKMLGVGVGDSISVDIGGRELQLRVSGIANTRVPMVVVNAEHLGFSYNMLGVSGAPGLSGDRLLEDITAATALEMAAISGARDLLYESIKQLEIFISSAAMITAVIIIFVLIAMINNLTESYRSRAGEFELYRLGGMSSRSVRRMKLAEVTLTLGFGFALGLVAFLLHVFATNAALNRFSIDLFVDIRRLLLSK